MLLHTKRSNFPCGGDGHALGHNGLHLAHIGEPILELLDGVGGEEILIHGGFMELFAEDVGLCGGGGRGEGLFVGFHRVVVCVRTRFTMGTFGSVFGIAWGMGFVGVLQHDFLKGCF